ncbi:MAG: aspartate aminotransferase family protein [Zestosphaera sp.]
MLKQLNLYTSRGLRIVRGEGQYVWDVDGVRYLDCHTGHGVAFLGHRNPKIVRAVNEQLGKVMTLPATFDNELRDEALVALGRIVPKHYTYAFFLNSGSEAVDFALKVARKVRRKVKFVSFINSFHGRTFGALSLTWNPRYREPFKPLLDVEFARFNDVGALEKTVTEDIAAVVVEPVQGEGGINPATREFMKVLREVTESRGALLIVDEIQTGCGRTGYTWASDMYGVYGDVMLIGKAIGGGVPVSIALLREDVGPQLGEGDHGTTFGGNPIALAAVKAAAEVLMEEDVAGKACTVGSKLLSELGKVCSDSRVVRDVRGVGLMVGVELRFDPKFVIQCLQREGVIALKAGNTVVRLLPPYLINDEDVSAIASAMDRCLDEEVARRVNA